jgi:enoyl-CoA hydratase/carnithine racemase
MATKPLSSLIETKRLMKAGVTAQVLERINQEGMVFGRMLKEPAAIEAFSAFMEKRKPVFN